MVFGMLSGVENLIIDVGIVVVILLILKMLKIPMIITFGEKSTCVRNEQLIDKENIFNKFLLKIGLLKTGHDEKEKMIDEEVKKGLQEVKIVAGEVSEGTRETIRYCLDEKKIKVLVVAGHKLKCPTENLEGFIANPNFKLRILEERPKHHKAIIGQSVLLEEYHAPNEPYKKALAIEKAYAEILDYHNEEFESLFREAQEIKSPKDLHEKIVCLIEQ